MTLAHDQSGKIGTVRRSARAKSLCRVLAKRLLLQAKVFIALFHSQFITDKNITCLNAKGIATNFPPHDSPKWVLSVGALMENKLPGNWKKKRVCSGLRVTYWNCSD